MLNGQTLRRVGGPHLPLRRMMLCLDCEECFEIGAQACPKCGGETSVPLARFLEVNRLVKTGRPESRDDGYVVIVARDQPAIYRQLAHMFAGDDTFDVVIDRRRGDRRRGGGVRLRERRLSDRRRAKPHVGLGVLGWLIAKRVASRHAVVP